MTVAFDAASSGGANSVGSGSTLTFSHTVGSGADRVLLVAIGLTVSTDKISGVTYNGVAMTRQIAKTAGAAAATFIYSLVNPAAGTHDVVITMTDTNLVLDAYAASFTGVDQTTPVSATNSSSNAFYNSPANDTITVASGGMAVDVICGTGASNAFTAAGSQTELGAQLNANTTRRVAGSYLADATAMGWSWTTGQRQATHSVVALSPAAGGGGGGSFQPAWAANSTITISSGARAA